ncbi:hypothetical protein AT52_00471 [Streptococcus equi subsp. zooepidemicus Sz35]|uniref:Putative exported protein n=1 Tax=Streptococcus equi subsp. zooepidemicus (strain H70) TaxID=553483 RepID=C0MH91_STRS7|nr:hypothetical protein [Streptococcus equi]AIA68756.1 hypothetical protein Q426_05295 [Streptococcus equi subsp. zooepidemicus CY]KIS20600.1 hypothetical protein AT52_00471 [Streptococcus equi subsp. zooepidemicus Sz35]MBR7683317.1 hypothetical protein [Streptococcus equi subsp. zooepidemicus]MBR7752489.1 hypothetical protein [Streptococcus equi subsp. zooepidemicus]MBR7775069.1 hypothetical protein [Streptococcus equi subsp. zooepidemicus]
MKVTKALCALVAATTLALAPISSSPTPTQTVFAATHSQGNCYKGWCRTPDGHIEREGRPDRPYQFSWWGWFLDFFGYIGESIHNWFR